MGDVLVEQAEKFFDTFSPKFLSVDSSDSFVDYVVHDKAEFVSLLQRFKDCSCYACFNQVKEKRLAVNVVSSEFLFLDADTEQQYVKLLEELDKL